MSEVVGRCVIGPVDPFNHGVATSLRDQIAISALAGLVSPGADYEIISRQAYQIADMMLEIRQK